MTHGSGLWCVKSTAGFSVTRLFVYIYTQGIRIISELSAELVIIYRLSYLIVVLCCCPSGVGVIPDCICTLCWNAIGCLTVWEPKTKMAIVKLDSSADGKTEIYLIWHFVRHAASQMGEIDLEYGQNSLQ